MLNSMKNSKSNIIPLGGDEIVKDVGFSNKGINDNNSDDVDQYPYQLRLYLNDDILQKLGVNEMPPFGASLDIIGKCKVIGITAYDDGPSLVLQITDMSLGKPKEDKPTSEVLYGGE